MTETFKALDQKEEVLLAQLAKVREARAILVGLFGTPEDTQSSLTKVTKGELTRSKRKHLENPNIKAAFDTIIPVIEEVEGADFNLIKELAVPIKGNKSKYASNTIKTYLSALRASGFIKKEGKGYHII